MTEKQKESKRKECEQKVCCREECHESECVKDAIRNFVLSVMTSTSENRSPQEVAVLPEMLNILLNYPADN